MERTKELNTDRLVEESARMEAVLGLPRPLVIWNDAPSRTQGQMVAALREAADRWETGL